MVQWEVGQLQSKVSNNNQALRLGDLYYKSDGVWSTPEVLRTSVRRIVEGCADEADLA
jgi:hypothetical protein